MHVHIIIKNSPLALSENEPLELALPGLSSLSRVSLVQVLTPDSSDWASDGDNTSSFGTDSLMLHMAKSNLFGGAGPSNSSLDHELPSGMNGAEDKQVLKNVEMSYDQWTTHENI